MMGGTVLHSRFPPSYPAPFSACWTVFVTSAIARTKYLPEATQRKRFVLACSLMVERIPQPARRGLRWQELVVWFVHILEDEEFKRRTRSRAEL